MKTNNEWIGIDFGTCYSCAARIIGNIPVMIPVRDAPDEGTAQRPTIAYINKDGIIKTGYTAQPYQFTDPSRFWSEFKLDIANDARLIADSQVTYADLVSAILADIREDSRLDNNNHYIDNAVITIPAVYSEIDPRRKIMITAAKKAGYKRVELLYEPEAAALYYEHISGEELDDLTLVYDLGGGTFDPALIERTDDGAVLLKTGVSKGLTCGGNSFDFELYKLFKAVIPDVVAIESSNDIGAVARILSFCREVKHLLSGSKHVIRPIPFLKGKEFSVSRVDFNRSIEPSIDQTLECCSEILSSAKKKWSDLSRILLVGGSSRVPLVREKIVSYLETLGLNDVQVTQTTISRDKRLDPLCAVSAGAAIVKRKGNNNMDAEVYEKKRNELIEILDEVLAIDELRVDTRVEINKVKRKSLENNFEIVLVGEFQGGKSTTFNAICDGREISPRGAMIKTSACKISASNLSDDNTEEYAYITWKDDHELLLGMIHLIESYLRREQPDRFGSASQKQMVSKVDLSQLMSEELNTFKKIGDVKPLDIKNPNDLQLIRDALAEEWDYYKDDPAAYGEDNLDVLYISTLIAHFIDSPEIEGLRQKNHLSVYDMGKLVTFPMDWASRWMAGAAKEFKPEEIAFAFVANVHCYIHSENLARLGCVVTDCPGLFNSPWDTEVAQRAMLEADAILYLFGGSKTLDQGDIRALNEIRKVKMEHKLVYAINVKGQTKLIQNNILPENVAKLCAQGFNVADNDLHLYHALLGLCSRNGRFIMENRMDLYSSERFLAVAQTIYGDYGTVKEAWIDISDQMLANITRREAVDEINDANIRKISQYSGLDELFNGIEQAVIMKKAYSILVSQGSERVSSALKLLEGDLKTREASAKKTEADFKAAVVLARKELEHLQSTSQAYVDELKDELLLMPLAENFENEVIIYNIEAMSDVICRNLSENVCSLSNIVKLKSKKQMQEELTPMIIDSINSIVEPAFIGWVNKIEKKDMPIYETTLLKTSNDILSKINAEWKNCNSFLDLEGLLYGLEIKIDFDIINLYSKLNVTENISHEALSQNINRGKMIGVGSRLAGFTAGTVVYLIVANLIGIITYGILLSVIGLWPAVIATIGLALIPGVKLGKRATKSIQRLFNIRLKKDIVTSIQKAFGEIETKKKLREASLNIATQISNLHISLFYQAFKDQYKFFEERIEKTKKDFSRSEKERRELAHQLNELRTKKITPVKAKVDSFLDSVLKIMNGKEVNS